MSRWVILGLAAAVVGLAAAVISLAAQNTAAQRPALHTIYCAHGAAPAVGFLAGGAVGAGCPPGFHQASR